LPKPFSALTYRFVQVTGFLQKKKAPFPETTGDETLLKPKLRQEIFRGTTPVAFAHYKHTPL
jgi:hypothetical protein